MSHSSLDSLAHEGGELVIGGVRICRLVDRVGSTPFYAYDRGLISKRIAELRESLPSSIKLHYAIKSNPMAAVVQHLATLVDGFDVASHGEMLTALDAGMRAASIGFAGPGKRVNELRAAIASGICISIESELELQRVTELADAMESDAAVSIRINPDFELKQAGAKMGGHPSQFGIDAAHASKVLRSIDRKRIRVRGLHIYAGSQNLDAQAIIEANRLTFEMAAKLMVLADTQFEFINIGGGYGIPYFPRDRPLDLHQIGESLDAMLDTQHDVLGDTDVVVELGRYIVGEAGYYITTVTDVKQSQGKNFAIVDGGLHHHLANSGNFGQILRKNYPVVVGNKVGNTQARDPINIVGPLCTPLDVVADSIALPDLEVGDFIVVLQSGAYGYSASPHQFLSHPPAHEVLV